MALKFAVALLLGLVTADQPSHCLREKVYGMWEFHVSKDVGHVNLFETEEICTHQLTNKLQIIGVDDKFSFAQEEVWKLSLMDHYQVEAMLCSSSSDCAKAEKIKGKWSPIYAQGMVVELDNGMRFVTNYRYNLKPELSKSPSHSDNPDLKEFIQSLDNGQVDNFVSECDKTMVGFVMLKGGKD